MTAQTIPGVAARAAALFGMAPAVVEEGRTTSFAELWQLISQAASSFAASGLAPGERVAIWAPNCRDWIVACAGAQAAGGVVVPLNTRLKGAEAAYILRRARVRFLVLQDGFLGNAYRAMLAGETLPHLQRVLDLREDWPGFMAGAQAAAPALPGPQDACDILFTSGTTGQPKGVVALHGQTIRTFQAWCDAVGLRAGDRYLIVNPFFHSFGYKAGWLACLLAGATAYPMASLAMPALTALVAAEKITVLPGPPAIFQTMLAHGGARDFSSLRVAVTGAASVPPALVQQMRETLGIAKVLTGYGLTESCGVVTMTSENDPPEAVVGTCGRPIEGVELRIDAPPGEAGEVLVRGFNVMAGYFEDEAATREAIDAQGWLHTGDVGRLDAAGRLVITDRLKDMYISGGFNCYPAEIERILQTHPEVAQAAVIGVPDARLGEVGCAFIVPRAGMQPDAEALLAWARANMANYKAPRHVRVVDALPLNAAGKVQKFALAGLAG